MVMMMMKISDNLFKWKNNLEPRKMLSRMNSQLLQKEDKLSSVQIVCNSLKQSSNPKKSTKSPVKREDQAQLKNNSP